MQPLERPTRLSGRLDRIGLRLLILILCVAWFYLLWGRLLQATLAGLALACLWYLTIRLGERRSLATREQSLRRKIGGQLAVDSLILQSAQSAASNAATWLSSCLPMQDFQQVDQGVLTNSEGKSVFIACLQKHPGARASPDDVLHAVRDARGHSADICIVCATCPFSTEAVLLAEDQQPKTRLLGRDKLIQIAGAVTPATNEQLHELGKKQNKARFNAALWKARLIQPGKAKRYGAYGLGMMAMLAVTRQWVYTIPAVACLLLFYLSRRERSRPIEL
ncbi:MAG TPA: hypothetical protein PKE04_06745 [Clostridia bacterium]|nr:hypothetical protein [Clostridia bacterium]